jgi:putative ABC transport system permease protein
VTRGAVLRAASAGAGRRLVPTAVIFLVLAAGAAAALLGLTLATNSNELFLTAFTRSHGAQLAVTADSAKATGAQLAATRHLPGVTQAAGPYPQTFIKLTSGHATGPPPAGRQASGRPIPHGQVNPVLEKPDMWLAVVGRPSPSGPLDDISLQQGRWATRPGEIVIDPHFAQVRAPIGSTVTVASAPGKPKLTVVGYASSIAPDEAAWVAPSQVAALRPAGVPAQQQMLYTFAQADTASQVSADLASIKAALPAGAVHSWVSWLSANSLIAAAQGINTPFVVAFAVIALVLAVLITASVVAAAVIASYRRIGVLKSIGFTPAQVTATYLIQIGLPALAGVIAGTALGDWRVLPLVNGGNSLFNINVSVPLWINLAVPVGMLALTGVAAAVPALRAGRLRAVQAITAGQAPPAGRGYGAHRLLGKLALPRPVTAGLAAPLARPARSAVTLAAITFGLTAVVLATGLGTSLARLSQGGDLWHHAVMISASNNSAGNEGPGARAFTPRQQQTVATALAHQPWTASYAAIATTPPFSEASSHSWAASVPGVGQHVPITAFRGAAARLGWDITSGHWYSGPRQVVVNTAYPGTSGLTIGQAIHITVGGATVTATITGTVYDLGVGILLTSWATLHGATGLTVNLYIVGLRPGVKPPAYTAALGKTLGHGYNVENVVPGQSGSVGLYGDIDTSLIRLLTVLVAVLAGLGVLNATLMLTRERVHDLGVCKAVGMTPRQTIAMVTCWAVPPAVVAAVIALPAGMALHDAVIHALASDQSVLPQVFSTVPASVLHVYTAGGLTLLALAGLAIAIAGALGPATWAAASRTTTALRTE